MRADDVHFIDIRDGRFRFVEFPVDGDLHAIIGQCLWPGIAATTQESSQETCCLDPFRQRRLF